MPKPSLAAAAARMPKAHRQVGAPLPDDLAYLPDLYAMPVVGDCLAPEIPDGAVLLVDKTQPYAPGDLVVLFRRAAQPGGQPLAMVKRLVMAPPPWVKAFPYMDHPESDIRALVGVEQINPRRQFFVHCADILAIHRCLGAVPTSAKLDYLPVPAAREIAR